MTRKSRLNQEERRTQLLRAARTVAIRDGLERTTLRTVAAEAKVSHGLIVHYFGSIEGVQSALLQWLLDSTMGSAPIDIQASDPSAQLVEAIADRLHWYKEHDDDIRLLIEFWAGMHRRQESRSPIGTVLSSAGNRLEPFVATLLETRNQIHVNARDAASVIGAYLLGAAIMHAVNPQIDTTSRDLDVISALLDQ